MGYDYPETEHPSMDEYFEVKENFMYNQNNGNRNGGYPQRNNSYNGGYNRGGNNGGSGNASPRKHSGAKRVPITKGQNKGVVGISAWNFSRDKGLVSLLIAPYGQTHEVTSKSGRKWQNWMVKATFKRTGQTILFSAMVDASSMKATIKDLGWVVNPSAPNGGYCGTFRKR